MKKIFNLIISLILITNIFAFSLFAQAPTQQQGTYNGIRYEMVSFSRDTGSANTPLINLNILNSPYFQINYQNFGNGFQFLFDLIIGISIATSVILFMIAAFRKIFQAGDVGAIKAGNEGMQNAIVGLMIVLSTWLIINTINPDLIRLPIFSNLDNIAKPGSGDTSNGGANGGATLESSGQ